MIIQDLTHVLNLPFVAINQFAVLPKLLELVVPVQ
jgi:hypothetical protein